MIDGADEPMIDLWPTIETSRTRLRRIGDTDLEFMFRHFGDGEVCKYLVDAEPVTTREEAMEIIRWSHSGPQNPTNNRWLVVWKDTDEPIGTCGYHRWDTSNHCAEIGYDLTPSFWRRGIMTEVLVSVIPFGLSVMKLNRIEAFVHLENHGSYRLLQRLGFHCEGIVRARHYFRGAYYDHYSFSLLSSDWQRSQAI